MISNWHKIWDKRTTSDEMSKLALADLMVLDGYDKGAGAIDADDYRTHARRIANKIELSTSDAVYEVGCGSGAFLYALRECVSVQVSGSDYSSGLIQVAQRIFSGVGQFECIEASRINSSEKYDVVLSHGVFHYFELEYARIVLEKMWRKAKRCVCVLEVPDLASRDESEELRSSYYSPSEYKSRYQGLQHTYFERAWFSNIARENNWNCEIFDGCYPNYAQNRFRFNVLILK